MFTNIFFFVLTLRIFLLLGLAAGGSRVLEWARFVFVVVVVLICRFCSFETAQYGPHTSAVFSPWNNRGHSGKLNKKHQAVEPLSYVHLCSVDWNDGRIYVSIERIAAKKRENTGKQNALRVTLNVSASNVNVFCEIVSRSGFAIACEYCISSSSNVSNLWTSNSNTVPY